MPPGLRTEPGALPVTQAPDLPHYSPSPDRGVQGLLLIFRRLNNNSEQSLCCLNLSTNGRPDALRGERNSQEPMALGESHAGLG